ncbi:MAG: hypothetical protein CME70_14700 [Halobacteriovorax sp.]|nr:hypothetical protein [Halobacteriovorax sp.]|tara:strand:+ start:190614 stop:191366 length:753 start_codon:yes stop_codon:yes gene_type:complete
MKKYLLLFITLLNTSAFGAVDYNIKAVTRSYPVALSFIGTLGYGQKLWGQESGPLYGYVRPSAYFQTSGVINGAGVQLDFFPISFLGFYGGAKKIKRSTDDLGSFNCLTTICNGTMSRNYIGSKLGLAFKSIFLFIDGKSENVEVDDRVGIFAEETGTLLGQSGGDKLTQVTGISGIELNKELSFGILVQHSQMDKLKNKSVMTLGISRMKFDKWGLLLGAGQFHTRQSSDHFTVMALLTWTGAKGIQLL